MTDVWKIGSLTTNDLTGKTIITGAASGATVNTGYCIQIAGVDYAVTAGKTLTITGIIPIAAMDATTFATFQLRYADNAALTTNPVGLFTISAYFAGGVGVIPCKLSVAAGKYVGIYITVAGRACSCAIVGYEA